MAWELTYAELAARGVLLDLNTMLARDQAFAAELKSDGIGALYDTFTFNGGQYAFPEQWSGNYLFYNKRLFAEAGVPAPPRTWEQPWSFAEFLNTATALTKRNGSGRVTQWGFVNMWFSYYSAGLFAMNNGVPWSTPLKNPTHFNFDNDAFIEAVQFYADLANKHKVAPNASEVQSMSTPDLFAAGKAAIAMGGHWRYQTFIRADGLDFDVASLPVGPRRQGQPAHSDIGSTGLAISASSQRKEQAWEFVKFATGPVGQALIAESSLFVPVLRSALNSTGFAKAHQNVGNLAVLTQGPAYSEGLPVTPAWEKIVALMDRNFGPVLRGSRPATSLTALSPASTRCCAPHDIDRYTRRTRAGYPQTLQRRRSLATARLGRPPFRRTEPGGGRGVHAVSARILAVHELSAVGRVQTAKVRGPEELRRAFHV